MVGGKKLRQRAAFLQAVRAFFQQHGYLEVETPIRQPLLIPEAQIVPFKSDGWLLQSSPELCMKRLLAQGQARIFQICKCFRAGERGRYHLPEFTMLEWYRSNDDYHGLMAETALFLAHLGSELAPVSGFSADVCQLLAASECESLTVAQAFALHADLDLAQALRQDCFDEVLVSQVEPNLGQDGPCFLYDYPASLASLARRKEAEPELAERFELYIRGVEIANGFSELIDAREQRQRFQAEIAVTASPMPERFLADLEMLESEACGIALGLDRLLMLLTGATAIDQVVAFTPEDL
ncbi:MAG: EF-P lysine aminoacylase EpmA [Thermodesulfobacteriota bacterium]